MVTTLMAPLYGWGKYGLDDIEERADSDMFYENEVLIISIGNLVIAIVTFIVIGILAWRGGRTYCNAICPVGTVLGFLSRFSLFRHQIDESKCNSCGLCARNCTAACIDAKKHTIDYSRCVTCFDCIYKCKKKATRYEVVTKKTDLPKEEKSP